MLSQLLTKLVLQASPAKRRLPSSGAVIGKLVIVLFARID